jgi:hypothetical protein
MTEAFDSAFGGGAKGFSYNPMADGNPNPFFVPTGAPHGGKVLEIQTGIPVTEFTGPQKGQPKYWDDAKTRPMLQKVITVDTRAGRFPATPASAEDDGLRSFWVRDSSDLDKAISKALKSAPGLRPGSMLYAVWTGDRPSKGGGNPAHCFQAQHEPAAVQPTDGAFFGGGGEQASAAPQQPAYVPPAAPVYNPQVAAPQQPTAPYQPPAYAPPTAPQQPVYSPPPTSGDPFGGQAPAAPRQPAYVPPAAPVPSGNPFA